jgi:hypothetical protein
MLGYYVRDKDSGFVPQNIWLLKREMYVLYSSAEMN